jgi:carboxylesterase type B
MSRLAIISFLLAASFLCYAQKTEVIQIADGSLRGLVKDGFRVFFGIPYAEPPVGNLRWKPPLPVTPWAPKLLNATAPGNCCPQKSSMTNRQAEDCLYLNVFTPANASPTNLKPVMVWIHGGAWWAGCSTQDIYYGDYLTNTSDVVVVSMNYRLGALGFLYNGNGIEGNYGFMDQVLALQWVQSNVRHFGGDPNQVTLFGQSAGAISVGLHLTQPYSYLNNYFHKAIMQSNPWTLKMRDPKQTLPFADTFSIFLGCVANDTDCLLSQRLEDILSAQMKSVVIPWPPSFAIYELPFEPTVDNKYVIDQPIKLVLEGNFYQVPILMGTVQNESLIFLENAMSAAGVKQVTEFEYSTILLAFFGNEGVDVFFQYPPDNNNATLGASGMGTDYLFMCPTRASARSMTKSGVPVYYYHFLHSPSTDPSDPWPYCQNSFVCHTADVPFSMNTSSLISPRYKLTTAEQLLADKMARYWAAFAKSKTAEVTWPSDLMSWPKYDPQQQLSMAFDLTISIDSDYNGANCDFWDEYGYLN